MYKPLMMPIEKIITAHYSNPKKTTTDGTKKPNTYNHHIRVHPETSLQITSDFHSLAQGEEKRGRPFAASRRETELG
jgi:hypothetical protein